MALLFMDGFDAMDTAAYENGGGGNPLKYYFDSYIPFNQCSVAGGRFGGQCLFEFNTGFAQANFSRRVSGDPTMCAGFALQLSGGLAGNNPLFFSMATSTLATEVVGLAYESATGKLEIWRNGNGINSNKGTLVKKTDVVLPTATWTYLELFVVVAGASSVLQVWQDDTIIADFGPSGTDGTVNLGSGTIDYVSFRWEAFGTAGYNIDDYYIVDGTGLHNNTRLGPCRVMSEPPIGDAFLESFTRNTGSTDFGCVDEFASGVHGAPDYLVTYLAGTASCADLFNVATMACVGLVLGVAVNATFRGPPPASVALLCQPIGAAGSTVTLASLSPPGNGTDWACLQGISETNLATGGNNWTDGDIGRAWWGAGLTAGDGKWTQLYIEKLVSLRAVKFDCGNLSSYAVSGG